MKKEVTRISEFGFYLKKILRDSNHHAKFVKKTALMLATLVTIYKDSDTPIYVFVKEGATKRVAWVKIKKVQYAFSFNHDTNMIEIRKGSLQGEVILELDDTMDAAGNLRRILERGIDMKLLIDLLNTCLASKGAFVQKATNLYALPPYTKYDSYEEVYREYKVMRKVFTILIRKTGDEYWVRCGYKDSPQSQTVEGLADRDITSRRVCIVVDHCYSHIDKLFDILDQ